MQNSSIPPAQVHNISHNHDVDCAFLMYSINIATGEINFTELQSHVMLKLSANIEKAVCNFVGGHCFDWDKLDQCSEENIQHTLDKKFDSILSLLVYNHRLDIGLDVSDMYLLIKSHNRIILTTESLMKLNLGFVTHPIDSERKPPVDQPDLICKTDLFNDHAEFYIVVHHLVEADAQGSLIAKHTLATFEPLDYHAPLTTQSFEFLCAHEKRNECKTEFDSRLHYDFFLQNWESVKGVSIDGILPNGNILSYEHADVY